MLVIEVWKVMSWDGGDRHNFAFYVDRKVGSKDEMQAQIGKHDTVYADNLVVFDSIDEAHENSIRKARINAWHKLTPVERRALNLPLTVEEL